MPVKLIENGCPACGSDLRGNHEIRFFCMNCNILFKGEHLETPISNHINPHTDQNIY